MPTLNWTHAPYTQFPASKRKPTNLREMPSTSYSDTHPFNISTHRNAETEAFMQSVQPTYTSTPWHNIGR